MDELTKKFNLFSKEVCECNRFFYSDEAKEFLKEFYAYIDDNAKKFIKYIDSDEVLYRARPHAFSSQNNDYIKEPFNSSDMKPVPNVRANGRLNAYNVNALYLAYDKSTAISEVRANAEAPISVAKFKTNKKLKIVRFDNTSEVVDMYSYLNPGITYFLAHRFSQPLDAPEHQSREYIPTQIIAEFLKSKRIDGIEYPSQFISYDNNFLENKSVNDLLKEDKAFNVCLFDIDSADCDPKSIEVLMLVKRINIISLYKSAN